MTLAELKIHTSSLLKAKREIIISEDEVLISLANEIILNIANRYLIVILMTKNINDEILRDIGKDSDGEQWYMKIPATITTVNDILDLDDELLFAVSNYLAAAMASEVKNTMYYERKAGRIVKNYSFKLYKTLALS